MSQQSPPDFSDPNERSRIIEDATWHGRFAMIKPLAIAAVVGVVLVFASVISVGRAIAGALAR